VVQRLVLPCDQLGNRTLVALVTSTLVSLAMTAGILWYAKRRKPGTSLTWAQAILAATYVFFLVFLIYGVVPHQWLTFAENEWSWRKDRFLFGPGDIVKPQSQGGWFPFDLNYRVLSDTIAVVIYGIFIGGQIWMWAKWQNRGKLADESDAALIARKSTYGRPLIKQG
jgi:hypothetical protein